MIFIILWDVTAVFIKELFSYLMENDSTNDGNDLQIGRIIGKLERIIVAVLVLCKAFGAIGFVVVAKSIARYKQLEEKDFAKKYLVGTLSSVGIAFIVTIILKELI